LEQLYDRAGEKKDPKLLSVSWSITLVDPPGASAEIEALFETEDRLDTEERGLFMLYGGRARMSLTVSGPTEDWVEATFGELHPIIKAAEIGGIYKPLLIFRRQGVVWASSFTLAAVGSYAGAQYSSDVAAPQSPSERLNDILVNRTIDQRFEAFLRDFYIGLQADSVVPYAISIIAFMGLAMLGYVLFPKLIPRSTISIGLAKRRFAQHRNAFTFVIFTLGLLGIILPIIVNLLTSR